MDVTTFDKAIGGVGEDMIYIASKLRREGKAEEANAVLRSRAAMLFASEGIVRVNAPMMREFDRREMEACSVASDACAALVRRGLPRSSRTRFFSTIRRSWPGVTEDSLCADVLFESMLAEWYRSERHTVTQRQLMQIAKATAARARKTWLEVEGA